MPESLFSILFFFHSPWTFFLFEAFFLVFSFLLLSRLLPNLSKISRLGFALVVSAPIIGLWQMWFYPPAFTFFWGWSWLVHALEFVLGGVIYVTEKKWYMYALNLFMIMSVVYLLFMTFLAFFSNKYLLSHKVTISSWSLFRKLFLVASIVMILSFVTSFFLSTYLTQTERQYCLGWQRYAIAKFDTHLKDVCDSRSDQRECPRTEDEVAAFDHQTYDALKPCVKTKYIFDELTQTYTLFARLTNNTVFIASSHHPLKAYQLYWFPEYHRYSSIFPPFYPPPYVGPWDKLPR